MEVEAEVIQSLVEGPQQGHKTVEDNDLIHIQLSQENNGVEPELRKRYSTRLKNRTCSWEDAIRYMNNVGEEEGESLNRRIHIARDRWNFC